MTAVLHVSVTAGSLEVARRLLTSAVRARLAAGGRIGGPYESVFWHEGTVGAADEWTILLITTEERFAALRDHLLAEHEWDNPEIAAVVLDHGSEPYLRWARDTVH